MSTPFEILQYNTHKSKDEVMATFLRDPEVLKASIIAIQEPWKNEYDDTTHQPARLTHQLLHPKATNGARARVALYVNKKIDPARWTHTTVSPDYQILHLRHVRGAESHDLYIHNIYNDVKLPTSTLNRIDQELTRIGRSRTTEHIVLGDMNVHHPAWGGPGTKIEPTGRRGDRAIRSRYGHAGSIRERGSAGNGHVRRRNGERGTNPTGHWLGNA